MSLQSRGRQVVRILATAGVALLGAAPAAGASTGVSVDVGSIEVNERLEPGGEYRLPTFGVRNPGTEPTTYRLVVSGVAGDGAAYAPASWFAFDPAELTLTPESSRAIATRLTVPVDAQAGDYAALIGPEIKSAGSGAQVGATAAVRVTFTVGETGGLDAWLRLLARTLSANPWLAAVAGLLAAYGLASYLRRRFSFQIARRR